AVCTILAMIATLPLAQLFFFHILLIKKGISTYDYIIALREQEQQGIGGQQSPQMSPVSSLTGLSSASSFTTFHRGAWCTPPRLFLEDQFDVVPPETASNQITTQAAVGDEWPQGLRTIEGGQRLSSLKHEVHFKQVKQCQAQLGLFASSPESSLDSPDIHPFRVSSTDAEEARRLAGLSAVGAANLKGIPLSRSTSDGYEASGGEDSDRVPTRIVQRSTNWTNLLFSADQDERAFEPKSSSSLIYHRKL
ncbi:hypothetical protein SESBI_12324, partial [Sesbania bispinosa]